MLIPKLTWWILFEGDFFNWKKRAEKCNKTTMKKKSLMDNYGMPMQWKH